MDLFKKLMIQHLIDLKRGACFVFLELVEIIGSIIKSALIGLIFGFLAYILIAVFIGCLSLIYFFGAFIYNLIFNIYCQLS